MKRSCGSFIQGRKQEPLTYSAYFAPSVVILVHKYDVICHNYLQVD
ncbi:hypothetical protein H206_06948 [Candidatus Electrothrix aarhusensis]|uniref:Uncharacterized protein n=1 Tax=Candidatus Electrothrix aarhusensis TaxID=1859131 RepID=A0A3S4TCM2_9BACT|nr:hypothetical protein H206_06948 [Candidatus Electrothrix aarhusensis]